MLYYGIFALCNVHKYCKMFCSEWIMIAFLKTCTHVELQIGAKHMVLVTFLVFTMALLSITIRGVFLLKYYFYTECWKQLQCIVC